MKKLYRSRSNRKIAGICGGIGNYFTINPAMIRIIFLCICIFTAILPLLIAYFICIIIIPIEPKNVPKQPFRPLFRSKKNRYIAGIIGGIAELINVDATFLRIAIVFLCFISGILPLVLVYIIAWIIIHEDHNENDIDITYR